MINTVKTNYRRCQQTYIIVVCDGSVIFKDTTLICISFHMHLAHINSFSESNVTPDLAKSGVKLSWIDFCVRMAMKSLLRYAQNLP